MTSPFAVVTGASTGIGLELARQFLEHGHDVLVCADEEISSQALDGPGVQKLEVDLRARAGVQQLYQAIKDTGRGVDALALNAGVGQGGAFVEQELEDILSIVELNVTSTVHLARLVLTDMVARNSGRVLVLSSIASLMPGSYQAVYNASKSFLQSFTQAVQAELSGSAVTLTALMPGPTETQFFERADMADNTRVGQSNKDDPAKVAAQGYTAMMAGKRRVVGGGSATRAQYFAGMVLPDVVKAAVHSLMAKPQRPAA